MTNNLSRRKFLHRAGGAAIAGASTGALGSRLMSPAHAASRFVAVTWGGPLLEANKVIGADYMKASGDQIAWDLHEGGAANILGKIKASWPTVRHDMVQAWNPVFHSMIQENWLADVDDVAGLSEIVPSLVDQFRVNGKAKVIPVATDGSYFGYRTDMISRPITKFEDLLDPSLKGKIGLLDPAMYSFTPYIAMALEFGGSEKNIEPGWEFLKRLAASGNVGQVLKSDVDTINALTTGAIALSYTGIGNWGKIDKVAKIQLCNRMTQSKGLKAFLFTLGWVVLKGGREAEAKRFASYLIRADHNETYAKNTTASPANVKAKASPELAKFVLTDPKDLNQFAYFADFPYISSQLGGWAKRFETEIMPLLRKA